METPATPRAMSREVLESCSDPCFVLSEVLDITYCNAAWNQFALLNQGGPEVLSAQVISRNLLDFIPDDLKKYYVDLFARARSLGKPVSHDYECSSATLFRLYRMQIYPLDTGIAVINSVRLEHPHDRTSMEPNDAIYRTGTGLIRMCANCRRTNRANDPAMWDWVPAYVDSKHESVSHGVCPPCAEYYYRPYLQSESKDR